MKAKLIIVLAVVVLATNPTSAVPVHWEVNGHRYEPVGVGSFITWDEAHQAATDAGGYLVTITSAEENDFVFSLIDFDEFWG